MTSDAKVGLLLGLVFIVAIAFLINGLPGIISSATPANAVDTTVRGNNGSLGLVDKVSDAANLVSQLDPLRFKKRDVAIDLTRNNDSRYIGNRTVAQRGNNNSSDKKTSVSTKKYYTVKSGDNLGTIARKNYGPEFGNKQATVDLIFQANSKKLSSPDDISIGQKLIMPSLGADEVVASRKSDNSSRNSGEDKLMETGLFKRVGTAFKNVLAADKKRTSPLSVYVVKDGDSLWNIAEKRLGNGSRYREIIKLNNSILKGNEDLDLDMKLKIPQK